MFVSLALSTLTLIDMRFNRTSTLHGAERLATINKLHFHDHISKINSRFQSHFGSDIKYNCDLI